MADMNFGSTMNMLVGQIIDFFFCYSFVGYYPFQSLYFIHIKERKKRILENTVTYFFLQEMHVSFAFTTWSYELLSFFATGPNDIITDLDYCLCTFCTCFQKYSFCTLFTLL